MRRFRQSYMAARRAVSVALTMAVAVAGTATPAAAATTTSSAIAATGSSPAMTRTAAATKTVASAAGTKTTVLPRSAPGPAATGRTAAFVEGRGAGFVWASDASAPFNVEYSPPSAWQYNSSSPFTVVNTVRRIPSGLGSYGVTFPNLSGVGVIHVTPYGGDAAYCNLNGRLNNFEFNFQEAYVQCYSLAGARIDHQFTVSLTNVQASWQGRPMAYLTGGGVVGQPSPWDANVNSTGAVNTVTRSAAGSYVVRLPNLGGPGGHVQVTAFSNQAVHCKPGSWFPDGSAELIHVLCFDRTGSLVDSVFGLTYVDQLNILGLSTGFNPDGHDSAYAWADQPSTESYQPHPNYQFANFTATAGSARRTGTGRYDMRFQYVNLSTGGVHVTAYGWGPELCVIAYWNVGDGIQTRCYDRSGTPVDTYYNVSFTGPFMVG
jgi:hypothetical protein